MISQHYNKGPNAGVVSDVLGAFWRLALHDENLAGAICRAQGLVLDYGEGLERSLLKWLGEPRAGSLERAVIPVDIPPGAVSVSKAAMGDGLVLGGDALAIGQASPRMSWRVRLPVPLRECPFVGSVPDRPLLVGGVDYELQGRDVLVFAEDPAKAGFKTFLAEGADGPEEIMRMMLISCVPEGEYAGYGDRYGRYRVSGRGRNSVFSLLTGEASVSRLLNAVMGAAGAALPTIFDEKDEKGEFTWILRAVRDGNALILPTSAGQRAVIPLVLGPVLPEGDWKCRPGDSLCSAVRLLDGNPPVMAVSDDAAAALQDNLDVFRAIRENLPAGNPLVTSFSASLRETAGVALNEDVTAALIYVRSEDLDVGYNENLRSRSHL